MRCHSLLPVAIIGFLLLFVSACSDPLTETRPDLVDEIPENAGLVAVQVINNTNRIGPYLRNWTEVFVVDLNDPEIRYRLRPSNTGLIDSQVFIGALPPGDYRIFNLHSLIRGEYTVWMNAPISRDLGRFRVERNILTSLGTIVYQPLGEVEVDRATKKLYTVARVNELEDLTEFVRDAFPVQYEQVAVQAILGWEPDPHEQSHDELAQKVRAFAFGMEPHRTSDGLNVMTGKLGQIFVRRGEADWLRVDTGYSHQLLAFVAHENGFIASGERGLVLAADHLEGPWSVLPGPGSQEAVYWMTALGNGNFMALALASGDNAVRLYLIDSSFSTWKPVFQFDYKPERTFSGETMVRALHAANDNIILFADQRRVILNEHGDIVDDSGGRSLHSYALQPDGMLVARPYRSHGGAGRIFVSDDKGETWVTLPYNGAEERRTLPSLPVMEGNDAWLMSIRRIEDRPSGRVQYAEHPSLRRSNPDGEISEWGAYVDEGCARLLPALSTPDQIFLMCEDGRILLSTDRGQSWSVDFKPGDRQEPPESMI